MMPGEGTLIFIGLVFAAVFFLAQGMAVPVFGEGRQVARRLKRRLSQFDHYQEQSMTSLLRERSMKRLNPVERRLESLPWLESLSAYVFQSGNSILAYRLVLAGLALAVLAGLLAWIFSRSTLVALGAAAVAGALPFAKIAQDRQKRFARIEEQLPEAIDVMQRALRAGHPFSGTLKLVAEDMEQPIAREFELTFADINYGNDIRRAMLGLLSRVPSVTVMALVTSVLVQKETGGNLAEILKQISSVLRGRFRLHRKVKTLSAEGRLSAWVLAMVPLVLFGALTVTAPEYLPALLEDPLGVRMIWFAVIWGAIGVYLIRRIIRIQV